MNSDNLGRLERPSPNRMYLKKPFGKLDGLHALRGYFFSFRPGNGTMLMNINTVVGALFLPGCRVSDLLHNLSGLLNESGIERMLQGAILRITYERKERDGVQRASINAEESRRKTFQGFGATVQDQEFPDRDDPNSGIKSVLDYFRQGEILTIIDSIYH
jgi:eukaryotic translation initiation factor 2C